MQDSRRVRGLPIFLCGLEANLLRRFYRGIVEAMSQPSYDARDMQSSVGAKYDFQQNLALNFQVAGLRGIDGYWFGKDFRRDHSGYDFCRTGTHRGGSGNIRVAEACLTDPANA